MRLHQEATSDGAFRKTATLSLALLPVPIIVLLLLAIHLTLTGCASTRPSSTSTTTTGASPRGDASAIVAVLDTMAVGWNTGDLSLYLSGYADDVVSRGTNGFVVGRDAARKVMLEGFWKAGRPQQRLHYEHLSTRMLSENVAVATGQYVLSGGGAPDRTGWFTTIWTRSEAGWRCVHDHS